MALLQKAYLGATPLFRNEDWFEDGSPIIINKPNNVTLTADTTAHTKGAWTQIIASTSGNVSFVIFNVGTVSTTATNTATLLDIGTGASGSETVVAANIAIGGAGGQSAQVTAATFGIPLKIASGTRVAARIQSVVTGGKTAVLQSAFIDAGDYATAPTSVDVIGSDTATSQGVSFSGSSGTWVEAIASTSQAYRAVTAVFSMHSNDIATINTAAFDIGVGASSSEVAFGTARVLYQNNEQVALADPFTYLFGRSIPAGSRLAVKHNIAANPTRYGFTLIGIP
jgi:hypothetical protein